MRQHVKELADAMEKGWKLCPRMVDGATYFSGGDSKRPTACCAKGHAFLAIRGDALPSMYLRERFEIFSAFKQEVMNESGDCATLFEILNDLVHEHGWTTPQVIAWLRTHEND